jgi:hypothetical protein
MPDNSKDLIAELKKRINKVSDEKIIESQFKLWSNEWMLAIVVLLFSLEWFLRKQSGML